MRPSYDSVAASINAIEAEMRRIGMWQEEPPPAESMNFRQAFAIDKLGFEQWLQFVFIPRVHQIIAERGLFPSKSEVSAQAFREWNVWGERENADRLITLLREFDSLFGS